MTIVGTQPTTFAGTTTDIPTLDADFGCPHCDRRFKSIQARGVHLARTHKVRGPGKRDKLLKRSAPQPAIAVAPAPDSPIDAMLAVMFPTGIPAEREVLSVLLEVMDAYERLAEIVTRP